MNKLVPPSPLAERLNALGASTVHSHVIEAISSYPPLARKGINYAAARLIAEGFSDQQILQMAKMVMANAALNNEKALRRANVSTRVGQNRKAADAKLTTEAVKRDLIGIADRYLKRDEQKDPSATAHHIRQGCIL